MTIFGPEETFFRSFRLSPFCVSVGLLVSFAIGPSVYLSPPDTPLIPLSSLNLLR